MMFRSRFVIGVLVTIGVVSAAAPAVAQQFYVTDRAIRDQITVCKRLDSASGADNQCLYDLAVSSGEPLVCNYIFNDTMNIHCQREVRTARGETPRAFAQPLPLIIMFFLLIILVWFKPPRSTYMKAALIGLFIACLILYIRQSPLPFVQSMQASVLPWLILPVDGLMSFAPQSYIGWPFPLKLIIAHILVYTPIIGMILHGERDQYSFAGFLTVCLLLLTFWNHPVFVNLRGGVQELGA